MYILTYYIILTYFLSIFSILVGYSMYYAYIIASLGNTNLVFSYPVVFTLLKTTLLL